jgi:hypothetical protein
LLATPENAELLLAMAARGREEGWPASLVEVGNPLVRRPGTPAAELAVIAATSPLMRWRAVSADDLVWAKMAVASVREAAELLRLHPVWPALSFIDGLNVEQAARLVVLIGDPRWYRHPHRPGRLTPLETYLGLFPRNVRAYLRGHCQRGTVEAVLSSWYDPSQAGAALHTPGGFLRRTLESLVDRCSSRVIAMLRCARRFLLYLVHFWCSRQSFHPEWRFDADELLLPYEAKAFRSHCRGFGLGSV